MGAAAFRRRRGYSGRQGLRNFQPLRTVETPQAITVAGGTFQYVIDRATGQIVSAKALDTEFVTAGTSFPNPYVGVMPEDDRGRGAKEAKTGRASGMRSL